MSETRKQHVQFRHDGRDLLVLKDLQTVPRIGEHVMIGLMAYVVVGVVHHFIEEVPNGTVISVQLDAVEITVAE